MGTLGEGKEMPTSTLGMKKLRKTTVAGGIFDPKAQIRRGVRRVDH